MVFPILVRLHFLYWNSPFSQIYFPYQWAARTPYISSWVITTNCRLYSNIPQILLWYKTWQYQTKVDSSKSLGVCYWCVKIPQCAYMEHGLKDIAFYVQKHITPCTVVITSLLVRDKLPGVPTSVKWVYYPQIAFNSISGSSSDDMISKHLRCQWLIRISGFPEQMASNEKLCCFYCHCLDKAFE